MTVRLPIVRAVPAVLVLASLLLGAAGADASAPTPTFDWPLECPATVAQRYAGSDVTVDVTYDVEVVEVDGLPGVIAVEFGPAAVEEIDGGGRSDDQMAQVAAYFTNPVLEVEADGSPVEAVGFEEWLERFEAAGASGDASALEREITRRASAITWQSWVGLWSSLAEFDGAVIVEPADDGSATFLAERTDDDRVTSIELVADAATLTPETASYEVRSLDGAGADVPVVAYEWSFDWPACDGARSTADVIADAPAPDVAPAGFDTITLAELPPEALDTLSLIEAGGPFPYRQDGAVFENREGVLPDQPFGYYQEYTVETPGSDDRGARRLVTGDDGALYYTDDHYDTFRWVVDG